MHAGRSTAAQCPDKAPAGLRYEAAEVRWQRTGDDAERVACCGLLGRKVQGLQYHADKVSSLPGSTSMA
jgi:hypothetical protein